MFTGAAAAPPSSGFNFGTNTAAPTPSGGFSFGTSTGTPAATPSSGFSFGGNATTQTPSSSAFGISGTATPSFGTSNTTSTPSFGTTGGSLFGSTSTPSFGGTGGAAASNFSFATPSTSTNTGFGGFGTTTGPPAVAATAGGMFGQQNTFNSNAGAQPQQNNIQAMMQQIAECYNTQSPQCAFQYILYNLIYQPQNVPQPPNVNPKLWEQGILQNPNPSRLIPVVISGFEGLKARIEEHDKFMKSQREAVADVEKFISQAKNKHECGTNERMEQYNKNHKALAHRLLQVIRKLEFYQSRGSSWYREEEAFQARLGDIQLELNKPTEFKGRLNEISSLVSMLDDTPQPAYKEELEKESLTQVNTFLASQTTGIKQLRTVVKEDTEEAEICLDSAKQLQNK